MMRREVFLIQKSCQEECEEYDDESSSSECQHIQDLVICTTELTVYIWEPYHVYRDLDPCRDIEYLLMDTIEDDEKDEVEEREEKHEKVG
jgi:hypothetical protein